MTDIKRAALLLLLPALLAAGCGSSKPEPPTSLCGVRTPASSLTPLFPEEGEEVTEKKSRARSGRTGCLLHVDGTYYFKVQHDLDDDSYNIPPGVFTAEKPRTFTGELGVDSLQAVATATCPSKRKSVFADITLTAAESDKLYTDSRDDLAKFLNAYMPNVQKHYGCKT